MFPLALLVLAPAAADDAVRFNRDVRPILSDACFACHGPDAGKRKAKLRLDVRESAVDRGAIVPGKPAESELVARLNLPDADEQSMPPDAHKKLTAKQKDTLTRWVQQGAAYEPHWAYIPPVAAKLPADAGHPVDYFVRAELAKYKITPSPAADKRTLVRRVTLDLTGLPPTPEAVAAFAADARPDAFAKMVESLLNTAAYGERMATPWLDLVRFADTVGYHGDQNQRVFPYRDYVIDSFRRNKRYDAFVREQLAGDLLPDPTPEQLTATGFNRLNMMTREGGAQPGEYFAKYQADRVRTVSMAFLGGTMGCAECHDHKFDPFTAKDFYAMSAFFADVRQWGVYADYGYTPNPDLRGWTNDHPFPPELEVPSDYYRDRINAIRADLPRDVPADAAAVREWAKTSAAFLETHPTGWVAPPGGEVRFTGPVVKGGTETVTLVSGAGRVASVRVELLPVDGRVMRDAAGTTTITPTFAVKSKAGKLTKLAAFYGDADRAEPTRYAGTAPAATGLLAGWKSSPFHPGKPHAAVWLLEIPPILAADDEFVVTIATDNAASVRVSVSPFGWPDLTRPAVPADVRKAFAAGGPAGVLAEWFGFATGAFAAKAKPALRELYDLRGGKAWTQVTAATTPAVTRVLPRGNWMDATGPVVLPAVPGFLPQPAAGKPRLDRLDLANWITSKQNPLAARVFVNRVWKQFFGTGLSAVLEDLGGQGEPPSHPELFDFLAAEFASDWDVNRLVTTIITSATYQQSSRGRPEFKDLDPNNRLLAFLSPRRLEAEFIRDNALAAAGLLDPRVGGPSAKPYQPDGYYANLQFPDRKYAADAGPDQYRRGLYTHWQRTFLHPMLANFDAPSREECTASRPVANTPQQALTLLNDPTFVEAARVLGAHAFAAADADAGRLDFLFRSVLARPAKPAERETLLAFLAAEKARFAADPAAAKQLLAVGRTPPAEGDPATAAAWAGVCRVVLNLHEAITRY